jgi:lysophospholipase L1-like esterase
VAAGKQDAANGWMRAVGTQFLILVLTLTVAEVVLRVIDLRYLRLDESGVQPVYAHDAELGWFPIPNSAQTYTGSRTVQVHHNSIGLRDIEPEPTRKPTIAFVGDSFVWGYDSEEGERFTDLLRGMMLNNRIANLGVNAYGTDQEYLMLKRLWERFTPAVVVLMVCVDNDRIENATNLRYDGPYKPYFDLAAGVFGGQPVPWSRHLYFGHYWLARHSWVVRVAISAYVYWKHPPLRLADPTERLIDMMRDMVTSKGGRLLVGLQRPDVRYEGLFAAQKIPYVTLEGAEAYPTHGNHWTPKGNAFVAERMKQFLKENGIGAP